MSPTTLEPENDCADEDQQQLYTIDLSSPQRGCYIRTMTARFKLKKKIAGREPQGPPRQAGLAVNCDSDSNTAVFNLS
jgi:hypothetical protein